MRPLWSPRARLAAWLALAGVVSGVAATVGLRTNVTDVLARPLFIAQLGALLAAAGMAAAAALQAAIPGREGSRVQAGVALLLSGLATALVAVEPTHTLAHFVRDGLRCAFCVGMFGALSWVTLFVLVRRAAPFDGRRVGAYLGGAAALVGAAAVRIACPIDDGLHIVTWHMLPVAGGVALSAALGRVWLTRWDRSARSTAA